MRSEKRARADTTTTGQAAHSVLRLRYELSRLAAQGADPGTAAHAARLLRWAAAWQQQRIARTIAHHDARVGTPSAVARDDENDHDCDDHDETDRKNEPDDECDYDDDCDKRQQQPARLKALPRAGAEARARWALARASGALHKNMCGTGRAAGTSAALRIWNSISVVCQKAGCHALVDLKAARRQARARGSAAFSPGDGCASRSCSADYRRARFRNRQLQQADQVDSGERLLACWPTDCLDFQIYLHDDDYAREKADAARLATDDPTVRFDASDHDCADENDDDDNDDDDDDDD